MWATKAGGDTVDQGYMTEYLDFKIMEASSAFALAAGSIAAVAAGVLF